MNIKKAKSIFSSRIYNTYNWFDNLFLVKYVHVTFIIKLYFLKNNLYYKLY